MSKELEVRQDLEVLVEVSKESIFDKIKRFFS